MVAAEGTAFGAMAAATNGEHGSRRSARGQSSIFVSGTTVIERNRFRRASLIGSVTECDTFQPLLKKLPRIERNRVFMPRT